MEEVALNLTSESAAKRFRLSNGERESSVSIHESLESLKDFTLKRVLSDSAEHKVLIVEGSVYNDDRSAVIILEKTPFDSSAKDKFLSETTKVTKIFQNDIYGTYEGHPDPEANAIKVTVIHPATEKHIEKYSSHNKFFIIETPQIYKDIIAPHIEAESLSLQWVGNILEHKREVERVIFDDLDEDLGFVLLPDMKWDEKQMDNLYVLAICRQKDVRSLRDLTSSHLPLLKHIKQKGQETIFEKYGVAKNELRIYFHYQPSYYHLHIHFTSLKFQAPGIQTERAHLLDTVIANIELMPDYYSKITLNYCLSENDRLYTKLKEASVC